MDPLEKKKKKCNVAMALSDNDATNIAHHTTRQQGLRKGLPRLDLIFIANLLRYQVTTSRGRVEDERIVVDSTNTFAGGCLHLLKSPTIRSMTKTDVY